MANLDKGDETHRILNALKHSLRRQIICFAVSTGGPVSPVSTSKGLGEKLSNVTYHFKVLQKAEVFDFKFSRPVRGAVEHFYEPKPEVLEHPMVIAVLEEASACPK